MKFTQREIDMVERYYDADDTDIYDAYARPSKTMRDAYNKCIKMKVNMDGTDFRITGHSSYTFSCAFRYKVDGVEWLRYITKSNTYDINLTEYKNREV